MTQFMVILSFYLLMGCGVLFTPKKSNKEALITDNRLGFSCAAETQETWAKTLIDRYGDGSCELAQSRLTAATFLDLSSAELTKIDFLKGYKKLTRLDVSDNLIVDVSPLAELSLQNLNLNDNHVREVSARSLPRSLRFLFLRENRLEKMNLLPEFDHLVELDLSKNRLSSFSPPEKPHGIRRLLLGGNGRVSELSLQHLQSLRYLNVDGLVDLRETEFFGELKTLEKLDALSLGHMRLASLNLEALPNQLSRLVLTCNRMSSGSMWTELEQSPIEWIDLGNNFFAKIRFRDQVDFQQFRSFEESAWLRACAPKKEEKPEEQDSDLSASLR